MRPRTGRSLPVQPTQASQRQWSPCCRGHSEAGCLGVARRERAQAQACTSTAGPAGASCTTCMTCGWCFGNGAAEVLRDGDPNCAATAPPPEAEPGVPHHSPPAALPLLPLRAGTAPAPPRALPPVPGLLLLPLAAPEPGRPRPAVPAPPPAAAVSSAALVVQNCSSGETLKPCEQAGRPGGTEQAEDRVRGRRPAIC